MPRISHLLNVPILKITHWQDKKLTSWRQQRGSCSFSKVNTSFPCLGNNRWFPGNINNKNKKRRKWNKKEYKVLSDLETLHPCCFLLISCSRLQILWHITLLNISFGVTYGSTKTESGPKRGCFWSIQICFPSQHTFPPMHENISENKIYTKFSSFISGVLSHSLQYRGQVD